jgi:hypothetical protein
LPTYRASLHEKEVAIRDTKMKKTKRKIPSLRRDTSDNEIIRWTKDHDIFDRLDAGISEIVDDHSDLDKTLRGRIDD